MVKYLSTTPKIQKKRSNANNNVLRKNNYQYTIISLTNGRFEFVYFLFLRRWLKKWSKQFTKIREPQLIFFCPLAKNYFLSKKSKNSRMGKGKGLFIRSCILIKKNQTLFYFTGWPLAVLYFLRTKCLKKFRIKMAIRSRSYNNIVLPFSSSRFLLTVKKL